MDETTTKTTDTEVKISLAKLMKVKSRLAGRIAATQSEIVAYNSTVQGSEVPDVKKLYEQYEAMTAQMIKLKVALFDANRGGQQERIFLLAEKKSKLAWLRSMNTRNGPQTGYDDKVINIFQRGLASFGRITAVLDEVHVLVGLTADEEGAHDERQDVPAAQAEDITALGREHAHLARHRGEDQDGGHRDRQPEVEFGGWRGPFADRVVRTGDEVHREQPGEEHQLTGKPHDRADADHIGPVQRVDPSRDGR